MHQESEVQVVVIFFSKTVISKLAEKLQQNQKYKYNIGHGPQIPGTLSLSFTKKPPFYR